MITIDELRRQLDALQKARFTGLRRVSYTSNGVQRESEFKSDIEMATAIAALERQIADLEGTTKSQNLVIRSSKGW